VVVTVETDDALSTVPPTYVDYAYADGKYFGAEREFRGFGRAALIDAQGRTIVTEYHQDAARAGRVSRTWSLGNPDCGARADPFNTEDPCNPWSFELGREINDWGDPLDPFDPRPPLLWGTLSVPYYAGVARAELSKTTLFDYDEHGNETLRRVVAPDRLSGGAPNITEVRTFYDRKADTLSAGMPDTYIVSRPSRIRTESNGEPLAEKRFTYRNLLYASRGES
jgi:hypothetical protein